MRFRHMAALLVGSFGARIAGAALGLATQILLARNFSQSDVGTVFLTMSLASLLSIVSSLGYPALALTQLPQYFERNFGRAISAFHGLYLRDALSVTLLLAIVLYVGSLLFPVHEELRLAFIFGLLSAPFSSLIYYNCSVANSARRFVLSSMSDNIVRPGLFFCWVLVSVYLDWKLSIESILSIYVLSNVATAAIQYATLGKDAPSPLHMTNRKAAFSNSLRPRAASLAIVTGLSVAIADIITFLSGVFLEPADVAIVGVTIRLAAIVGFAIQSVQQFILPDLMKSIAKDEVDASHNILVKSTALTTGTMFVAIIGGITVGAFILRLLGKEYEAGNSLLSLFLVAQAMRALGGMNQYLLSSTGHQNILLYISVSAFILLVVSWLTFVPQFGLLGVGVAVVIMDVASNLAFAWMAKSKTGKRADFFSIIVDYFKRR